MKPSLTRFFNTLSSGLKRGAKGSVIGVDIGSSAVKIVQLRSDKGLVVLETYGELATGPYGGKDIGQATVLPPEKLKVLLTDLIKEANVTAKTAAMAIPMRSSLVVTIEFPNLSENNLETVVPIEARKYVPVPISEVFLDWWKIPSSLPESIAETATSEPGKSPDQKIEVLVAAIHRNALKQFEEISRQAALATSFFEIETFSLIRSLLGSELTPTALLDIGAGTSKLAIVDYGVVRVSHAINKGSQDVTTAIARSLNVSFAKAEEVKRQVGLLKEETSLPSLQPIASPIMEYLFQEARNAIFDYQKKHQRAVGRLILVGGGAMLKGVREVAEEVFEVPVSLGNPFGKLDIPAFLAPVLKESGPGFAVAIGLGLRKLQEV